MSRWIAAAGALLVSLDSMMNIAFPAIAAAFAVEPERGALGDHLLRPDVRDHLVRRRSPR